MAADFFLGRRAMLAAGGALVATSASAATPLRFDQLYGAWTVEGLRFSAEVEKLTGQEVAMRGFMAPPLKAEADFFVLSREPMALCPFCSSNADWPPDIVVVYLRRQATPVDATVPIETRGRLERGSWTDPATGFVSQLRLRDAAFRTV
ncbi:hypothetical protein [Teichococcus deserti]|nr:hypothetical protein [Pseudoroseomonas deserti]